MNWLGLDVGGANLKVADGRGFAVARPFPLWKQPADLPAALSALLADSPASDALAVTMTGELADCFVTKAEGVQAILSAVSTAAGRRRVCVYRIDGSWADPEQACREPLLAAASNWHGLAQFAARFLPARVGLMIDIGSTTTDIIPILGGRPAARGRTDPERLVFGELVYTGVQRSPLSAVVQRVPWRRILEYGDSSPFSAGLSTHEAPKATVDLCSTAEELFATTWDIYLLLGDLPEEPTSTHTADGRPATKEAAHDRIARSICADRTMVDRDNAIAIAQAVSEAQVARIAEAVSGVIEGLPQELSAVVLSGQGEFLGRRVLSRLGIELPVVSLGEQLGSEISRAATAHALAVLAREQVRKVD